MIKIAPSILSADFANLERDIHRISTADYVHVDVMDGVFVPNISIGIPVVQSIRKVTDMFLDVHLMIVEPVRYVERFCDAGADLVTKERFPAAESLICGDFGHIAQYITTEPEDYIVIMTSGHTHDFEVQEQILRRPAAYVGVIGSRAKTASVNARLRAAGVDEAAIASLHTPVGVAIKAVTPAEIALSIAGEMIYERALRREQAGIQVHGCPMH